jgi:hypothetical protein
MALGSGIRDPGSGQKPIPDPGSRGQKGTGSRIRIRNTGINSYKDISIPDSETISIPDSETKSPHVQ